jgi:nucleoside-diphosphate-sugar epimerase
MMDDESNEKQCEKVLYESSARAVYGKESIEWESTKERAHSKKIYERTITQYAKYSAIISKTIVNLFPIFHSNQTHKAIGAQQQWSGLHSDSADKRTRGSTITIIAPYQKRIMLFSQSLL